MERDTAMTTDEINQMAALEREYQMRRDSTIEYRGHQYQMNDRLILMLSVYLVSQTPQALLFTATGQPMLFSPEHLMGLRSAIEAHMTDCVEWYMSQAQVQPEVVT
jgi:hypothetical protein